MRRAMKKIYTSCSLSILFANEEIAVATKGTKNGKSADIDHIKKKQKKFATKEVADIFNEMANEEEIPLEIKAAFPIPLQKPGK